MPLHYVTSSEAAEMLITVRHISSVSSITQFRASNHLSFRTLSLTLSLPSHSRSCDHLHDYYFWSTPYLNTSIFYLCYQSQAKADLTALTNTGKTAIHVAAESGFTRAVATLRKAEASAQTTYVEWEAQGCDGGLFSFNASSLRDFPLSL